MKLIIFAFFVLGLALVNATGWKQNLCNGKACAVQFTKIWFSGVKLYANVDNTIQSAIQGGTLKQETFGYGCLLFICQWSSGPVLNDPACSFLGLGCDGASETSTFIGAGQKNKEIFIDFQKAMDEAKKTSGCCSVDSKCNGTPQKDVGCMFKGTATFTNAPQGMYSQIYIEFTCNSSFTTCTIAN